MKAKPAVFLDRDGTLIEEVHYLSDPNDIKLFQETGRSLRRLKEAGFDLFIITNQSGVARGYFDEAFVKESFLHLNNLLEPFDVQIKDQFHCPHHLKGKPPYNIDCDCRKPEPGMIYQALDKHPIDIKDSWVIGDKECDVGLASRMKIRGVLVLTGHGLEEEGKVRKNYPETNIVRSIEEAVKEILD